MTVWVVPSVVTSMPSTIARMRKSPQPARLLQAGQLGVDIASASEGTGPYSAWSVIRTTMTLGVVSTATSTENVRGDPGCRTRWRSSPPRPTAVLRRSKASGIQAEVRDSRRDTIHDETLVAFFARDRELDQGRFDGERLGHAGCTAQGDQRDVVFLLPVRSRERVSVSRRRSSSSLPASSTTISSARRGNPYTKETNEVYDGRNGNILGLFLRWKNPDKKKWVDVNNDGFSDVPNLKSTLIHPTLFFYFFPYMALCWWSGSFEKRVGGDMIAIARRGVWIIHTFRKIN